MKLIKQFFFSCFQILFITSDIDDTSQPFFARKASQQKLGCKNQNENDNYQEEVEQYDQVSTFDIDYRIEGFVS